MKIFLVENATGKEISLAGNRTYLGRHEKNDVRTFDPHVSNYHCSLERRGARLFVEDIKSSNGTYVNGTRITARTRLKDDDVIALAQNGCEYRVRLLTGIVLPLVKLRLKPIALGAITGALALAAGIIISLYFLTRPPEINVAKTLAAIEQDYGKKIFSDDPGFRSRVEEWTRIVRDDPGLAGILERRRLYGAFMESILAAENMPAVFTFIPWVESGYDTLAVNAGSGAAGMWQLMDFTARGYGLLVGGGVDERKDPEKATRAAARFLRNLVGVFGADDFLLILAAYNAGEGGVMHGLRQIADPVRDRNFWYLYQNNLIPEETKAYVVKIVACMVVEKNLQADKL